MPGPLRRQASWWHRVARSPRRGVRGRVVARVRAVDDLAVALPVARSGVVDVALRHRGDVVDERVAVVSRFALPRRWLVATELLRRLLTDDPGSGASAGAPASAAGPPTASAGAVQAG